MGVVRRIIFVICLIVFAASATVLAQYFINGAKEQGELEELKEVPEAADLETSKGIVIGKYAELYKRNQDMIGWICIEGTKVDYPVMQTKDDSEYYIHRNFDKENSKAGTPFMDAESDIFLPTSNFFIYGHNMKNGTMFKDILKYKDKSFYENNPTFRFDTIYKGGQGTYQVVAAGYAEILAVDSKEFKYYQYAGMTSKEDFDEYVNGIKAMAAYDTGVSAEFGDQLVTLSTCAYHVDDGRFFVVGKRIDSQ